MKGTITNQFTTRASLNLEMALLIMLLALSVIVGLEWMGDGINNTYAEAAGMFTAGGVSGPTNTTQTDNGDGTWTIGWDEGVSPYTIIEDGTPIDTDDASPYTYTPALPGEHEIVIEDGDGNQSEPVIISVPAAMTPFTVRIDETPSTKTYTIDTLNTVESIDALPDYEINITVRSTATGPVFDFTTNYPVERVSVKGGITTEEFYFTPSVMSFTDLHAPLWMTGFYATPSYVDFYFGGE